MRRDEKETDMDPLMNGIPPTSLPSGLLANAQLAPQGFFGNLLGQVGAPVGSAIGSALGNQGLGQTIGSVAGQLGRFLPFEAAPQFATGPQLAPQGFFGGLLGSALGGLGGSALGGALGNRNLGNTIGSTAGGILGAILPFDAGPQFVPQGFANVPIAGTFPATVVARA
jgi:hypothetical protein